MILQRTARDDELLGAVSIPYRDGSMPGYLCLVDPGGAPRPTVLYTNGFGERCEDGYSVIGAAALRRGYNFLAYDGPGQGAMLRYRQATMRPDWENVLGPVVDYAASIPEIDDSAIVQFGHGLGGYLVARYAAHDHRAAAIVCNDGMTTFYASSPHIPEPILELIEDERDDEATPLLDALMQQDPRVRWGLSTGQWVFGNPTAAEYVRRTAEYTLTADDIRRITTPVLVLESRDDASLAGQAANFARAMTAPVHHVVVHNADAVCETVFDYLAAALHR
jgi:alpha-beta hydrolase superfamily lysophospholipase